MAPDDGNIPYRLLTAETELRRVRERLHALSAAVAGLELTVVKRNGPLVDELRDLQERVRKLATKDEVRDAVQQTALGLGAKLWIAATFLAVFALALWSTLHG